MGISARNSSPGSTASCVTPATPSNGVRDGVAVPVHGRPGFDVDVGQGDGEGVAHPCHDRRTRRARRTSTPRSTCPRADRPPAAVRAVRPRRSHRAACRCRRCGELGHRRRPAGAGAAWSPTVTCAAAGPKPAGLQRSRAGPCSRSRRRRRRRSRRRPRRPRRTRGVATRPSVDSDEGRHDPGTHDGRRRPTTAARPSHRCPDGHREDDLGARRGGSGREGAGGPGLAPRGGASRRVAASTTVRRGDRSTRPADRQADHHLLLRESQIGCARSQTMTQRAASATIAPATSELVVSDRAVARARRRRPPARAPSTPRRRRRAAGTRGREESTIIGYLRSRPAIRRSESSTAGCGCVLRAVPAPPPTA